MSEERVGSGFFVTLKAGEELPLKGTNYIIKNHGSVSASLHIFTQEYKRQRDKENFAATAKTDERPPRRKIW